MPRRSGWFVVVERDGAHMAHPVDNQRQALTVIERLAPVVPRESWWFMEWRNG